MEVLNKIKTRDYVEVEKLKNEVKVHIREVALLSNRINKLNKRLNLPQKQDSEVVDELIRSICTHIRQIKFWDSNEKLTIDVIKGRSRKSMVASVRHVIVYIMRKHLHMSFKAIANILNRDHVTMMYSTEVVDNSIDARNKSKSYTDQTLIFLDEINNHLGFN
jgi:chromosomal replication initiation ATPase DnaA